MSNILSGKPVIDFTLYMTTFYLSVCNQSADKIMGSHEPELVRLEQNNFCKDSKVRRKKYSLCEQN